MDETYFLYLEKGKRKIDGRKARKRGISKEQVCILIVRDRQKETYSKVVGQGRIVKSRLEEAIGTKLSPAKCTDAWRACMTYVKEKTCPRRLSYPKCE